MNLIFLAIGLGFIVLGAEWLVDGASAIARRAGVSEFVIGLTIVGFGTSCPELVVSLTGAIQGNADIAIGNVVGSNIFNVFFILGLGICFILTGVCLFPFLKTGYRIPGQKEMFSHKNYLLPQESKSDIAAYIEGKAEALDIDPFQKGGLLLEQYYLKNGSKIFAQLFDYSTEVYSAQCELTEINKEKLESILKYQSDSNI